jgi:hypothetical protein
MCQFRGTTKPPMPWPRGALTPPETGVAASLLGSLGTRMHPAARWARPVELGVQHELSAYDAAGDCD